MKENNTKPEYEIYDVGHLYNTSFLIKKKIIETPIWLQFVTGILGGMIIALYLQNKGIDLGFIMKNASVMMPGIFRAQITPQTWYIGLIPGFISTQIGTLLAGRGIYKRQTSQLFKELEG